VKLKYRIIEAVTRDPDATNATIASITGATKNYVRSVRSQENMLSPKRRDLIIRQMRSEPKKSAAEIARITGATTKYVYMIASEIGMQSHLRTPDALDRLEEANAHWLMQSARSSNVTWPELLNAIVTDARLDATE
jgi:hypothetical protein